MKKYERFIEKHVIQSLKTSPVTYIAGPRQSGKTSLVQAIANKHQDYQYISFEDLQHRAAAQYDPDAFLHSINKPVIFDDSHMVPELFSALCSKVDANKARSGGGLGQFLLTGTANVIGLPKLSEAMAGRMRRHTLLPFSTTEVQQLATVNFIDAVFSGQDLSDRQHKGHLLKMMRNATFSELLPLSSNEHYMDWCNRYVNTVLQRDVRVLMDVEKIRALPDLLRLLATRTGSLMNEAALSRDSALNHATAKKYRVLLDNLFLTLSIPAWSKNMGKRLIKAPKIYINDINLLLFLLNTQLRALAESNPLLFGAVLENFVAVELTKQLSFSDASASLYHFRSASGQAVDFILEGPAQKIVGIDVKAKHKVTAKDFQHLEGLKRDLGETFHSGIVLYQGTETLSFGNKLWAVPFSMLWS